MLIFESLFHARTQRTNLLPRQFQCGFRTNATRRAIASARLVKVSIRGDGDHDVSQVNRMNRWWTAKIRVFRQGSRNTASREGRRRAGTALETGACASVLLPYMALDSGVHVGMAVMKPSCDCPVMSRAWNTDRPKARPAAMLHHDHRGFLDAASRLRRRARIPTGMGKETDTRTYA